MALSFLTSNQIRYQPTPGRRTGLTSQTPPPEGTKNSRVNVCDDTIHLWQRDFNHVTSFPSVCHIDLFLLWLHSLMLAMPFTVPNRIYPSHTRGSHFISPIKNYLERASQNSIVWKVAPASLSTGYQRHVVGEWSEVGIDHITHDCIVCDCSIVVSIPR